MAWIILTTAAIEGSLNDGELEEYRNHASQIEDPLPEIITDVTNLVRGYVSVRYPLIEAGIPEELRAPAIDVVIYRLAKRIHKGTEGDAQRKAAADDATKIFEAAAKGEFGDFSGPATSTTSGAWGSSARIAARA